MLPSKSKYNCSFFGGNLSVFRCDVPECPATFDVVGIEVLRLSSSEEIALPADGTIPQTLEFLSYELKSLLAGRSLYVRCLHTIKVILSNKDTILVRQSGRCA